MLPHKNRITRNDFPPNTERGFRAFSPLFSVVFYKIADDTVKESRVSVVVSKKTAKNAVVRNFLRRRFYDVIRPYLKGLSSPTSIIFYPKIEARAATIETLACEIEKALKTAKLIE